jgi:predicted phage baseplate assembly protein
VDEPFAPELPAGTLAAHGELPEIFTATAGRFRPALALPGLTHRVPFDPRTAAGQAAGRALEQDLRRAVPALDLRDPSAVWSLAQDLLASDRFARDFVVEMEDDGTAVLRFGDGELGRPPTPGTRLAPVYRVGKGAAGNIGPEGLAHAVTAAAEVRGVRNLLAAAGGVDPEPLDDVRRAAPGSLLRLETCTTERDFVRLAEEHPEVERAAASLRWTGSWFRLVLAVERSGGLPVDAAFQSELAELFEGHRLAGWELEIDALRFVGLDIALTVSLRPDAVAGAVERQLLEVFGNRALAGGGKGFFHPDNLDFGTPVYLSRIVETAMAVPGVRALDFDSTPPKPNRFRRFGEPSRGELATGQIRLSGLEMPRVDNDPAAPENGQIRFFLEGGR